MRAKENIKQEEEKEFKILLNILLKKANLTQKDIIEAAKRRWIASNLDLLTKEEKKQFKHIVLPND